MKELMYLLRAMQIYSQSVHHLVKGTPFHSDHAFFGDTYSQLAGDFDDVAERIVGIYGEDHLNLQNMLQSVMAKLSDAPSTGVVENKVFYDYQFKMEDKLKNLVKQVIASGVSPGVEQLIGEIANKSEMRSYKIKQRMK